uniref:DNA-directed DNA polymerase n=1 Tax=Aster yellows phytoplasma TaxID=35779 RepID=Q847S2_ASTYP|nr:putative DNA polymerase [Aster yellows phytoplasma]
MDYVMETRKQFKNVCVIAHNGQGFDFQFILRYILEETKFTPNIVPRGTKIILMEVANVRFIDSLSYFPMSLSALPKAFDLPPEKKKGYFSTFVQHIGKPKLCGPYAW